MSYRIKNTETGSVHESDQAESIDGEIYIRFADINVIGREGGEGGALIHEEFLGPIPGEEVFMEDPDTGNIVRFETVS